MAALNVLSDKLQVYSTVLGGLAEVTPSVLAQHAVTTDGNGVGITVDGSGRLVLSLSDISAAFAQSGSATGDLPTKGASTDLPDPGDPMLAQITIPAGFKRAWVSMTAILNVQPQSGQGDDVRLALLTKAGSAAWGYPLANSDQMQVRTTAYHHSITMSGIAGLDPYQDNIIRAVLTRYVTYGGVIENLTGSLHVMAFRH